MTAIPRDLIQYISDFCDTQTSIHISRLNANLNQHIKIFRIDCGLEYFLTDQILKQKKYIGLKKLNTYNNPNITTVNHMTALKQLNAGWNCGIDDAGIAGLNLEKLAADYNPKITPRQRRTNKVRFKQSLNFFKVNRRAGGPRTKFGLNFV
jgi:hypothetical protein